MIQSIRITLNRMIIMRPLGFGFTKSSWFLTYQSRIWTEAGKTLMLKENNNLPGLERYLTYDIGKQTYWRICLVSA